MEYPTLYVKQKSRQMADDFMGYNHNLRIGDGEFYDMKNMTSDHYPVLTPRGKRGYIEPTVFRLEGVDPSVDERWVPAEINGMIIKDKLCFVARGSFFMKDLETGEQEINTELDYNDFREIKELISMGPYVIILPDRKYVNTITKESGDIDAEFTNTADVSFTLCSQTGEAYANADTGNKAPENPEDEQLWIDTSNTPHTLKKYSAANAMWVSIPTTYIKLASKGIGKNFSQYDGVKISGITADGLTGLNGAHVLWDCKEDSIIIAGILDNVATQSVSQGQITVSRKMPEMDFIIESGNRLWGCRYGTNEDGDVVNEIYASKLGDFKNWNCFMNLSTDSYVVSCGTDGMFTGAITHQGYPIFFKENFIHKVYGDYPANFRVQTTNCRGVQRGSHKSIAIVNETLFYKSVTSVCAYDGSMPVEVSSALGDVPYYDAVAGTYSNKYYINMRDSDGDYHLFVFDTARKMWHKEDNIRVDAFCTFRNELYALEHESKQIVTMLGNDGVKITQDVPWMVESGPQGMYLPDMKYISKVLVRMNMELGSNVEIKIQYDSMGDWETVCQMTASCLRSFSVPIRLRRCDHFRIRIEGVGEGKIYSITKTIEQGSDVS